METDEIFWPARGTCGLNTGDVGLVEGGLQHREGCRRARGTPYILGEKIAMREHTWYIHEGAPQWAGRNRRGESPALPRNGDVLFEGGEGQAIFVCDVQHGISWARRKGLSRNSPE